MTEDEVKKQLQDAAAQTAADQLEAQIKKSDAGFRKVQQDQVLAKGEGASLIGSQMDRASGNQSMTGSTGVILNTAEGEARAAANVNAGAERTDLQNTRDLTLADALDKQNTEERERAQQKAETLARFGDFSGYEAMGYTPEETGRMKTYFDKQNEQQYGGLGGYADTLLSLYENNASYDVAAGLKEALAAGLITEQDYNAAMIAAKGIVPGAKAAAAKAGSRRSSGGSRKAAGGSDDYEDEGGTQFPPEIVAAFQRATYDDGNGLYSAANQEDWNLLRDWYDEQGGDAGDYFYLSPTKKRQETTVTNRNGNGWVYVEGVGRVSYEELEKMVEDGSVLENEENGKLTYTKAPKARRSRMDDRDDVRDGRPTKEV